MNEFQIMPVGTLHNSRMISILNATPINAGGLLVCFDKSPDIFEIPRMKYSECMHIGFFKNGELDGFASLGYHDALIKGEAQKVFTFFHFYILPCARGKHLPEKAARLFIEDSSGKSCYGYYIAMKGNRPVESYIGKHDHSWSPRSRIIDELVIRSILFSFPRRDKTGYSVRNARTEEIPEIVRLLRSEYSQRDLGQTVTEDIFLRNLSLRRLSIDNYYVAVDRKGYFKGTCLAWDCNSFRRTVVQHFSPKFYPVLYSYRLMEKLLPMAHLPEKGGHFNELTITDYATENRDVTIMHALLSEIYYRNLNRKYHFMNFGSCRSDELLTATKGFWYNEIVSNIVLISLNKEEININMRLPYIDIAFL